MVSVEQEAPTPGAPEPLRVRAMFDGIASRYDLLNHVLSMQMDRLWRRRAARAAVNGTDRPRVLDLCTGTGDLAAAIRRASPEASLVGGDFSLGMLTHAAGKAEGLRTLGADALALPFRDRSFDAVTVAFGVRNLQDRSVGFSEMKRVLRPGGRLVVLEFAPPPGGVFGAGFKWYTNRLLPRVASFISKNPAAYRYLPESVGKFPTPPALAQEMEEAGFSAVRFENLAFKTVALHIGSAGSVGSGGTIEGAAPAA